ncbi:MAG: TolC family protein [Olleya sp.]
MKIQSKKLIRPIVIAVASAITLAGCSVTPEKLTKQQITEVIHHDKAFLYKDQEPIRGELSLSDVMARALVYNLEHRTQRMAQAVALGQFELAKYDMLPSLNAQAATHSRSNVDASTSVNVYSGDDSDEPTSSQDQNSITADLGLSWNVLDFGVSYYQAKQEADRYLISDESRKKVLLSLLHQAETVYWQAMTAQQLQKPVQVALNKSYQALADIEKGIDAGIYPNLLRPLLLKKQMLTTIAELETLQESLAQARISLASLINAPLDHFPRLKEPESIQLPVISASMEEMELLALQNSTNLAEQIYSTRIERLETRKALLSLLPGLQFNYDLKYDDNGYLMNNNWSEASVQVSWNLMKLASAGQTMENSEYREKLAEQKRLAVSMAVVTQLNLSLQKYKSAQKLLSRAEQLDNIEQQILQYSTNSAAINSISLVDQIKAEIGALQSRQSYLQTLVSAHESFGLVWVSLGLSPVPDGYQLMKLDDLSKYIDQKLVTWRNGSLAAPLSVENREQPVNEEQL